MCAANWWPLVQGMMLMHRANLREATLATWARTQKARAKLRDSLWRAWVCRSLKIAGPHNKTPKLWHERDGLRTTVSLIPTPRLYT